MSPNSNDPEPTDVERINKLPALKPYKDGNYYCPKCARKMSTNLSPKTEDGYCSLNCTTHGWVAKWTKDWASPEPFGYRNAKCIVCHETIKEPYWGGSTGGGGPEFKQMVKDHTIAQTSDYWAKRKVELEISTWVGTGAYGAQHYYFKLQEENDERIFLTEGETHIYSTGNTAIRARDAASTTNVTCTRVKRQRSEGSRNTGRSSVVRITIS